MAKRQFHLSWFLSQGYGPKTWRGDWPGSDLARWMMPDLFLDLARGLERACFDYVIIEDSSMVPYTYQGSHDTYLRYAASTPKLDPAVLVPYLAQATKHLGLIPTLSVTEYPPFLLARLVNSLDHVTEDASVGTASPAATTPPHRTTAMWASRRTTNATTLPMNSPTLSPSSGTRGSLMPS